jgi:hypothetical protein
MDGQAKMSDFLGQLEDTFVGLQQDLIALESATPIAHLPEATTITPPPEAAPPKPRSAPPRSRPSALAERVL